VLAQPGRGAPDVGRSAGELESAPRHRQPVDAGHTVELPEKAALPDLRQGQGLRHGEHATRWYPEAVQGELPFGAGPGLQGTLQLRRQRRTVPLARFPRREALVGGELGPADGMDERLELFLLVGCDVDQTVPGPEPAGGCGREVVVAVRLWIDAGDQEVGHDPAHRRQRRVEHRHVDEDTRSIRPASDQGAADGERRRHAGERVGDRVADAQWRALARARDAHHPGQALDDLVVGRGGLHRTLLAEPGDRRVHQPRVDRRQGLVGEAEPSHDTRPEVLDQHVRPLHQALEDRLAILGLQVERHRSLAGVLRQERSAHLGCVEGGVRAQLTGQIASVRHLDLDHVRAHQRQLVRAERPRQDVRQVEDPDAVQRAAHRRLPLGVRAPGRVRRTPPPAGRST
jgi:hypothetical protein